MVKILSKFSPGEKVRIIYGPLGCFNPSKRYRNFLPHKFDVQGGAIGVVEKLDPEMRRSEDHSNWYLIRFGENLCAAHTSMFERVPAKKEH